MKVVLLKDVKGLGEIGKVLEVARGYARNYLLPRKLAKFASSWELAEIRTKEAKTEKQSQKAKNLSKTLAAELSGQAFEFVLPADSAGHLYAGLKESEIFAKIREKASELSAGAKLPGYRAIKAIGDHEIRLETAPGIQVSVTARIKTKTS